MIDIQEKKIKIVDFLKSSGPSLPVQVARSIQMDPVFASAILSELLSTKTIKTSNMRIGASPLYLLPGQEQRLEEKSENLKSIEKETQEKLKESIVLFDEQEEPAARVALRNIKDFATPFKFENKIIWKYAFAPQEKIDEILHPKEKANISTEEKIPKAWEVKKEEIKEIKEKPKKVENIFDKPKEKEISPKTFLEKIEKFLKNQNTTITSLEEVDKKKVIAIVESNSIPSMIFAFNRIRIDENELLICYKTASKKNLPYQIIINGNLTKKLTNIIFAHQKLIKIHKLIESEKN